ncbi:MAG TPA: hypothetical protein VHB79_32775 [Polyangiaceae bacterium]|nr:hypothetical protein [Polyangiaceae bacterium]
MCCFSGHVKHVSGTKIFARLLADGRQLLAYAMKVELEQELAMILPLPVLASAGEGAVSFIDLGDEDGFFEALEAAFPAFSVAPAARLFQGPPTRAPLPVFDVGRYVASFVPTPADFARLDPRFRLPNQLLAQLPIYQDYGFAVLQLKPLPRGTKMPQKLQPMALAFTPRESRALFFPTVHVHDGSMPARAGFDHALFCQADGVLEATLGWVAATEPLGTHLRGARSRELVDGERGGFASPLWGPLPNRDFWLREPRGVALTDLGGQERQYRYRVKASAAYAFGWESSERALWIPAARERLPALCRGLREGLAALVAARQKAWNLAPLSDDLPPHFMNGHQLWTGTDYMNGAPATGTGPGRIHFTPFGKHVEPQAVTLAFSRLPDQEGARALNLALCELVERAVA